MTTLRRRAAAVATAAVLPLALAACGGDADTGDTGTEDMTDDMSDEMSEEMTDDMSEEDMSDDMSEEMTDDMSESEG